MTLGELAQRTDIIGRDVETREVRSQFRGPIQDIQNHDGDVTITMDWTVWMPAKRWLPYNMSGVIIGASEGISVDETEEGGFQFTIPMMGLVTIYPWGENIEELF